MGSLRFSFTLFLFAHLPATPLCRAAEPERVSIAAAANLIYALDALTAAFRLAEPHVTLTVSTSGSGNLVTQIKNGAPFDIFLSADLDYPAALIAAAEADPATLTPFAVGRLVLWTTRADVPLDSLGAAVRSDRVRKLAIANLDTAPYGRAARQSLEKLGAWHGVRSKFVTGENITQTAQFVETGNADAGFVALSLVLSPRLKNRGRWLEVPADLHAPLEQAAVLTNRGTKNPAAHRFLAFLRSAAAREILERYGYSVPR